jgi:hypothetical protein
MKKLLLLTVIAATMFACNDKPQQKEINHLKGRAFRRPFTFNYEHIAYKLHFIDDIDVNLYFKMQPLGDDSIVNAKYCIYKTNETIKDTVQFFYIGFSNNEKTIYDTVGYGELFLYSEKSLDRDRILFNDFVFYEYK